jgi:hypothetical protein
MCLQVCIPLSSLKGGAHDLMRDECSHDSNGADVEEGMNCQNSRRIEDNIGAFQGSTVVLPRPRPYCGYVIHVDMLMWLAI